MAKCHWTQPRICALAASELLKWAITASFVPSQHGQREFNSFCISEINSSGNSREEDFGDLVNEEIMISH